LIDLTQQIVEPAPIPAGLHHHFTFLTQLGEKLSKARSSVSVDAALLELLASLIGGHKRVGLVRAEMAPLRVMPASDSGYELTTISEVFDGHTWKMRP